MDGMRFVVPLHGHGTLAADMIMHYKLPCGATLGASGRGGGHVRRRGHGQDRHGCNDELLSAFTFGASNVPTVTADRGDFNGDAWARTPRSVRTWRRGRCSRSLWRTTR